jgi:hypothetical protein
MTFGISGKFAKLSYLIVYSLKYSEVFRFAKMSGT